MKAGTIKGLLRVIPRDISGIAYRPGLFGLIFEPDGMVTATDGHMLLAFKSGREFDGAPFVIPAPVLRAAIKGQKARFEIDTDALKPAETISPPNWRQTVPDTFNGETEDYRINPEYQVTLRDAINEVRDTEERAQEISILQLKPNGRGPWLAYADAALLAIIMPMRDGSDYEGLEKAAAEFMRGAS